MKLLRSIALLAACLLGSSAWASERSNVLLFFIDDLRPQTSDYGHAQMHTPNFERLASSGVRFENAYCQVPTCGASRASLMTSLYPTHQRFPNFHTWAERDAKHVKTLPERFKQAGYTTISNGKVFHHPADTQARSWSEPAWRPETNGRTFYNDATKAWKAQRVQELKGKKNEAQRKKVPMWEAGQVDPLARTNVSGQAEYAEIEIKLRQRVQNRIKQATTIALPQSNGTAERDVSKNTFQSTPAPIDPRYVRWGDQGDGTYANPILNGDFADSDIERDEANDRWVMIASTNHYSPGMTILESTDLINWRYTGHAIPTINWEPEYNWDQMNGYRFGCWAGDLVHHNGQWLCYQIDFQSGLYLTRADDIAGPWSEPICLLKRKHWTDPSVYFDDETQKAWLVCNWGHGSPPQPNQPNEIKMFALSWDGTKLLDEGTTIFAGTGVEAAKIRRFNDQWYIMLIEWQGEGPDRDRKQLCLRSTTDSIYGPYESRVVMQREKQSDRSACQGSLIESPDGSWWFMHQLVQNGRPVFHGRPQCLQPVTWRDGWPIIGQDIDGDGIGVPIWKHQKPISGDAQFQLQTSDQFDAPQLGPQWNWNHEPRSDRFSLTARPGFLRLIASKPIDSNRGQLKDAFWGAPNTLSQRHLGVAKTTAETKLDLTGMAWGTRAGLCHHSGSYALLGVVKNQDGSMNLFFNNNGKHESGPTVSGRTLFLRSETDGDLATFSWSVDAVTWTKTAWTYTLTFGNWRGNRPGLFCWNNRTDEASHSGWIDVDWFRYDVAN